jgi:hypothetical protein
METTKLRRIIDKYKFTNILKIITILIVLVLLARSFLPSFVLSSSTTAISRPSLRIIDVDNMKITNGESPYKTSAGHVEGFTNMSYTYYGNQLTLQDPTNKPIYRGNTCTFNFDGMYRLEALTIIFNEQKNMSISSVWPFKVNNNLPVYIQYQDGNGNLRYIQSSNNTGGIPNFNNNTDLTSTSTSTSTSTQTYQISKNKLVDENNLAIYTSSIVITVGDTSNKIDSYQDVCGNGYISKFDFWGSTRDMLSQTEFEQLSPSLGTQTFVASPNNAKSFNQSSNSDTYTFTNSNDFLTYGLALTYTTAQLSPTNATTTPNTTSTASFCSTPPLNTDGPFKLSITYDNGLYPGNNFKINQTYIVRNDPLVLPNPTSKSYIQFSQPLIAKAITITVPRANIMDGTASTVKLNITGLGAYGVTPSNTDIANYQKNVNLALTSGQSSKNQDVCPSMDELVSKQNQAQAVCDNLEYQDKIKAEKIRLEKNKQYLLKLQQQQQQIDQLNTVIQTLDTKRQARATANDQARVLQYQQQRGTASTIRDLANQRLQSQAANQLYMDVNINTV